MKINTPTKGLYLKYPKVFMFCKKNLKSLAICNNQDQNRKNLIMNIRFKIFEKEDIIDTFFFTKN